MANIPVGSLWSSLGGAIGEGMTRPIRENLDLLAQKKLYDLKADAELSMQREQRKDLAKAFEPLFGKKMSDFLVSIDPQSRAAALNDIYGLQQFGQRLDAMPQQAQGMQALTNQGLPGLQGTGQGLGAVASLGQITPQDRNIFMSPQLKHQQALEQQGLTKIAQREREWEHKLEKEGYERTDPIVAKTFATADQNRPLRTKIQETLEMAKKFGKRFPTYGAALLPEKLQDALYRDPQYRLYKKNLEEIVTDLAQNARGKQTEYFTKLIEKSKAAVNQPIETQIAALSNLESVVNKLIKPAEYARSLANEKGGYPKNIREELEDYSEFLDKKEWDDLPPAKFMKGERIFDQQKKTWLKSDGKKWKASK